MKTIQYLCKWSSGVGKYLEWEDFKVVDKSFFNDEINFKILENFLKKNLTLDDVLDKIKYSGRESLTKIDYLILENKKEKIFNTKIRLKKIGLIILIK